MFAPDDVPQPPEACDECSHSLMLHDEDGCLVGDCPCTEPGWA